MIASPFDSDAPMGSRRAVIRREADELEMVELAWGLKPSAPEARPFRFVRSEGREFPTHRCLVPASEFHITQDKRRYRFTHEDRNWFYLAGVWRPACAGWPESYAIVTVAANPEVARYQDRQGTVLLRRQRMDWLDGAVPVVDLLQPLPAKTFSVEEIVGNGSAQKILAFYGGALDRRRSLGLEMLLDRPSGLARQPETTSH